MSNAAKPILFSAPMVQAILREIANPGTGKTQTRRIMKLQPTDTGVSWQFELKGRKSDIWANYPYDNFDDKENGLVGYCPYGKPGDLLYVRETWQALSFGDYKPTKHHISDVRYGATDPLADLDKDARGSPWRPSIHMPRWASRITLEVTDIRVQRLQDISEEDARAEGFPMGPDRDWETVAPYRTSEM